MQAKVALPPVVAAADPIQSSWCDQVACRSTRHSDGSATGLKACGPSRKLGLGGMIVPSKEAAVSVAALPRSISALNAKMQGHGV